MKREKLDFVVKAVREGLNEAQFRRKYPSWKKGKVSYYFSRGMKLGLLSNPAKGLWEVNESVVRTFDWVGVKVVRNSVIVGPRSFGA